jgi:Rrf2 family transcriptional regulator, cysteine metabolism repressor
MRLERASGYGLLALVYLAENIDGRPAQVQMISEATGVPVEYLRKLMGRLARARIIRSIRGRNGGFELGRQGAKVSVLDVIEALEGEIRTTTFLDDDLVASRKDRVGRNLNKWRTATAEDLRRLLGRTTLAQIISRKK